MKCARCGCPIAFGDLNYWYHSHSASRYCDHAATATPEGAKDA